MIKKSTILTSFLLLFIPLTYYVVYYTSWVPGISFPHRSLRNFDGIYGNIVLTVRMSLRKELIDLFLCSLLRSASVFWDHRYGEILLILDDEDAMRVDRFPKKLNALGLPFRFRAEYEENPKKLESFKRVSRELEHSYGYIRMLYSSFLMDLYTKGEVIAWVDTDVIFTQPVTNQSIFRNGRVVVKGLNNFRRFDWVRYRWDKTTRQAIGLPMVADFMSYFPVYVYPSTIRNCRQFIIKRLGVATMEDAFFRITTDQMSPVNIIMSYAYYYERNRYEWHIDTGVDSLKEYNNVRLPKHPLTPADIRPELHVSVHSRYYNSDYNPLERGLCYIQIYLNKNKLPVHCDKYLDEPNMQLFEFQKKPKLNMNHFDSWCAPRTLKRCTMMIDKHYKGIIRKYLNDEFESLNTSGIALVEMFAQEMFTTECPVVRSFPLKSG